MQLEALETLALFFRLKMLFGISLMMSAVVMGIMLRRVRRELDDVSATLKRWRRSGLEAGS